MVKIYARLPEPYKAYRFKKIFDKNKMMSRGGVIWFNRILFCWPFNSTFTDN